MSNSDLDNPALDAAVALSVEAHTILVNRGMSTEQALNKVKANFTRCNLSGEVVTVEQLTA